MPRYIGHSTANTDSRVERATVASKITGTATLYLPLVSDVNDDSSSPRTMAALGGAAISSTQKKFGAGSLYLDGVDDYVTISGTDWDFGSANFTIDGWFYCTDDSTGSFAHIIGGNASGTGWNLAMKPSDKTIQFYENGLAHGAASSWTVNTWHHIACVRNGTNFSTYIDGTAIHSSTISAGEEYNTDAGSGGAIEFGRQFGSTNQLYHYTGYLQDWRITKSTVCYTGAFTVPTLPRGGDIYGSNVNGNDTTIYTVATENKWNSGVWSISGAGNSTVNTRRKTGKWSVAIGARFLPPAVLTNYLVIAGGGGGGRADGGGGGGAGGYRSSWAGTPGSETTGAGATIETEFDARAGTPYTITVGAGGAIGAPYAAPGADGGVSSIVGGSVAVSSVGGGGGDQGGVHTGAGRTGGSGGGGGSGPGSASNPGGTGTTAQGFAGGYGVHGPGYHQSGGGGGGAVEVGANAGPISPRNSPGFGGDGGDGISSTISGGSVQRAGGGGGGAHAAVTARGLGGAGGGGNGWIVGTVPSGSPGTTNTGGGGGGQGNGGPPAQVGTGGSGVVILSVLTAQYPGIQTGGTVTTSAGYTIITYNSSGSYTG